MAHFDTNFLRCGAKLATINTADFQPFVRHGLTVA